MRLADLAWHGVSPQTIANCWQKSGILPTSSFIATIMSDVEDENAAETGLSDALNQLEACGVLQPGNRLNMSALMEMPEEQVQEDATDEEIHELVQKMRADRENQEINGGDDGLNDPSPEPKPSRKEAL
jgi:hypothetical protein